MQVALLLPRTSAASLEIWQGNDEVNAAQEVLDSVQVE